MIREPPRQEQNSTKCYISPDTIVLRRAFWAGVAIACFLLAIELLRRGGQVVGLIFFVGETLTGL